MALADYVAVFLKALGLTIVDVLGFSIGGFVLRRASLIATPNLVGRLVFWPARRYAKRRPKPHPRIFQVAANPVPTVDDSLFLFFLDDPRRFRQRAAPSGNAGTSVRTEDPPSSP